MTVENSGDNGDNGDNGKNDEAQCKYFIDLDWYRDQDRSFARLATSRLCPTSQKKKPPKTDAGLLNAVKQCCSKTDGYITPDMTLMESIFRLLLASGNRPLSLKQIQSRLVQRVGDLTSGGRDLSISTLKRVIDHDRFYGLAPIESDDDEEANTSHQTE
jgi:hypothetical protein